MREIHKIINCAERRKFFLKNRIQDHPVKVFRNWFKIGARTSFFKQLIFHLWSSLPYEAAMAVTLGCSNKKSD